jgi:hypothetical protein
VFGEASAEHFLCYASRLGELPYCAELRADEIFWLLCVFHIKTKKVFRKTSNKKTKKRRAGQAEFLSHGFEHELEKRTHLLCVPTPGA